MKQIKEERNILVYCNVTYKAEEDKLIQTYSFTTKRKQDLSYLFDSRFLIKNEIEDLIEKNLLNDFISRTDSTDKIEMVYKNQSAPSPLIKVINIYIPPFLGCIYCDKAVQEGEFIYCPEKNKHYSKSGIKRCAVFRTKKKLLT